MKNFIPIVIKPFPDELLYSWVLRLANANGLAPNSFFELYFGKESFAKGQKIPSDIRRGFMDFYNILDYSDAVMDLYFKLSTLSFELSFYPSKQQTRIINNILRPESKLNAIRNYFINSFKMCPECIKEDIEKYGEAYIHRSHQLTGVKVCHKHNTSLYEVQRNTKSKYDFSCNSLPIILDKITFDDCMYAKYTNNLLESGVVSNANDILLVILNKIRLNENNMEMNRKEIAEKIYQMLNKRTTKDKWTRNDVILPIEDTIKLLILLYPNIEYFLEELSNDKLIIKQHCENCGNDFYTTKQAIEDGWGCVYCDDKMGEIKLFEKLIKIGGNNEYTIKGQFNTMGESITLHHKICGNNFRVRPGNFLFLHTRCGCNQKLHLEEAKNLMKDYKNFKLIEFEASSKPAKFYHKTCKQNFEVPFRDFIESPKCRCCEILPDITQELFEKRVFDLVGNEYTVVGRIQTIESKVKIKHNVCGSIKEYKALDFLQGTRCPNCYIKVSKKKIEIMLNDYSNGRYKIIGYDKYFYEILDTQTNKTHKLLGKQIVQEILKPTPSLILPINHINKVDKQITTWDTWYRLCIEYKEEFGHLCPKANEKYQNQSFGDWCSQQRMKYNKGKLSKEEIQKLENIDFVFDVVFYRWQERFNEYKQYVAETGDVNPMEKIIYNGHKVGRWVRNQRHEEANGKLNPKYKRLLLEFNPTIFDKRKI